MVIYCKHCGAALRVDEARMPATSFRVKCHQCHNLLTVEPPKGAPAASRASTSATIPASPKPAAPSAPAAPAVEKPLATTIAAEVETEPRPLTGRTHYLQKIRLFSPLSYEEQCVMVESRLRLREFAPFQTIVKEGGPGDSMFIVHAGTLEVRKRDPNTGIEFLLAELKAGSSFGEIALLTSKPRTATVVATEPTMCGVLEQADLEELLLSYPKDRFGAQPRLGRTTGRDQPAGRHRVHQPEQASG